MAQRLDDEAIDRWVDDAIAHTPVYDLHTHLYPASFSKLCLWGPDELLTYHYLIAETFRLSDITYDAFWAMPKPAQADLIWKTLFVENAPVSEACRGVVTVLTRVGAPVESKNLGAIRDFFRNQTASHYIDTIFKLANVRKVVMTNDLFDPVEREIWQGTPQRDPRFDAVLRIDPLVLWQPAAAQTLNAMGYQVSSDPDATTLSEVRRFISDWVTKMNAIYVACSLEPSFRYPDDSPTTRVIDQAILPVCREKNIPFAVMIGVQRQVNPALKLAGDSLGKSDIRSLDRLCGNNQKNKFLCTMLSRENQHELAVTTRKHRNLLLFGCWWFLNNPVLIEEITRMRMELLGPSFVPQHSDCRILDQLLYKWDHSRAIIAKVLKDKFGDLAHAGWTVTHHEVKHTVEQYFSRNFEQFLRRSF
jgi:hypothetical protein